MHDIIMKGSIYEWWSGDEPVSCYRECSFCECRLPCGRSGRTQQNGEDAQLQMANGAGELTTV